MASISGTSVNEKPKILIIIVTWNKKRYVLDLLKSVNALDYPRHALDVLVVDNASQDGTADAIAADYPEIFLIRNAENIGGTGGFNTGLQWAFEQPEGSYKYLWLLDNDVLVHRHALTALVEILETNPDVAIAGSTMMQLDFPWRINEMGCFVKRNSGALILNRHFEEIVSWRGRPVQELLQGKADLTQLIPHCRPFMDVEYVAAASLVVRTEVAKQVGLWKDFFIHFDDVEWCLRIGEQGHRIVVSAQSLIWHLSAAAKVPTWVLYYDNRNVLATMQAHGSKHKDIAHTISYILKKGVYYALLGKADLSRLHKDAVEDFLNNRLGKKNITLDAPYQAAAEIESLLNDPQIKRILVSFEVNLQATGLQEPLIKALLKRPDLKVEFMRRPDGIEIYQLPRQQFISFPRKRRQQLKFYRYYDAIIQSDYHILITLSWLRPKKLVFTNDDGFCVRKPPTLKAVWAAFWEYARWRFLRRRAWVWRQKITSFKIRRF